MHMFTRSEMRVSENYAQLGDYTSAIGRPMLAILFLFVAISSLWDVSLCLVAPNLIIWAFYRGTSWFSDNDLNKSRVSL